MTARLDYKDLAPKALKALGTLHQYVHTCGLERSLIDLIFLRASQINGCAYCVDLHTRDAREAGESEHRLHGVIVWREAPFYTERERAALAWTEAVTEVATSRVPDDVYDTARNHFNDKELVDLTYAVALMNAYNRMAVSFRQGPEGQPPAPAAS